MEILSSLILFYIISVLISTTIAVLVERGLDKFMGRNPRLVANLEILDMLRDYAMENPDQRIGQVLRNSGVMNTVLVPKRGAPEWESGEMYIDGIVMHEEPAIILKRMKQELNDRKNRENV